jgi:hypothetical protein
MAGSIVQDYVVFQDGEMFRVCGRVDGAELFFGADAAAAIQAAIDAVAECGGEVRLMRGRYSLAKPVRVASNVALHGGGRATKLCAAAAGEGSAAVVLAGLKGAAVSDLAIVAEASARAEAGIILDDCGDCLVRDVYCKGFARYGIWLRNNSFLCELRGCKLADNAEANVYLDSLAEGGRGGDFVPNLVTNCIAWRGGNGFECRRTIVANFVACQAFQPNRHAFHLHHTSNSVLISGCRSFQCEGHAVVVENTHELNLSGNIFCWHRGSALVLRDVAWGAVNGNEFIDSGVRAHHGEPVDAVVLADGTRGVAVVGNAVFNWGDQVPLSIGIRELAGCRSNVVAHNHINYYTTADVVSEGDGTQCAANLGSKDTAHVGMDRKPYGDFDTKRIDRFMRP